MADRASGNLDGRTGAGGVRWPLVRARPPALDQQQQQAHYIAVVCSPPPEGAEARWTVRLLTERSDQAQTGGRTSAGRPSGCCWKATTSSRGGKKKKCGAWGGWNEEYIDRDGGTCSRHTKSLSLSAKPVICVDEKPVVLHEGHAGLQFQCKPGQVTRTGL